MLRSTMVTIIFLAWAVPAQTFIPLFDGTTLTGWKSQGQGKWEVQDGIIQGSAEASNPKNAWLISEKNTYRDFDFRFSFKGVVGNSGLNFRSIQGEEDVAGVQIDLDGGSTTGSLYDLLVKGGRYVGAYLIRADAAKLKALYKTTDWNQVELKVRDKHVQVALNGTSLVDYALAKVEAEGFFAFQMHDKRATRISLKDIAVAEAGATVIRIRPAGRKREPRIVFLVRGVGDVKSPAIPWTSGNGFSDVAGRYFPAAKTGITEAP